MLKQWLTATFGILAVSIALTSLAQSVDEVKRPDTPLILESQGSFFVGGETQKVVASGWKELNVPFVAFGPGEQINQQMYVQFQVPKDGNNHVPVVFMHGCCLTAKTWETTPDGRMGWYEYFTRKGHSTYLADQVGRGRSAQNAEVFNEVRQGIRPPATLKPVLIGTTEMIWNIFRFGPKVGQAWPDEQFPLDHIAELQKQIVPDFILYEDPDWFVTRETSHTDNPTVQRMAALAESLHGVVLVGHSQSSPWPTQAALLGKSGVRGIIGLETGCLRGLTVKQVTLLAKVPILIVVGDHLSGQRSAAEGVCKDEQVLINKAGGDMTFVALPDIGIHGNSHMFMQDRNNLQVADILLDWIAKHVETRPADKS